MYTIVLLCSFSFLSHVNTEHGGSPVTLCHSFGAHNCHQTGECIQFCVVDDLYLYKYDDQNTKQKYIVNIYVQREVLIAADFI